MDSVEFALTEDQLRQLSLLLFGAEPGLGGTRALLCLCGWSTGVKRRTILLREIIEPQPGDIGWHSRHGAVINSQYYNKAVRLAQEAEGAGILSVRAHRNPQSFQAAPEPTELEEKVERDELSFSSGILGKERPVAGASITVDGHISVREYTFLFPRVPDQNRYPQRPTRISFKRADRIRIVGRELRITTGKSHPPNQSTAASHSDALRQNPLSNLTIGIVGVSGAGGLIAAQLGRLGVGSLVFVDYGRAENEDFLHGFGITRKHVTARNPKVNVFSRFAAEVATAPNFEVRRYRESAVEQAGVLPLLDCDVILSTVNDPVIREVLDHVSYSHLIPVIDAGWIAGRFEETNDPIEKVQILGAGPGLACLECQGAYTLKESSFSRNNFLPEREKEIRRIESSRRRSITTNCLQASLATLRLLSLVRYSGPLVREVEKYQGEEGMVIWGAPTNCQEECIKCMWTGAGDAHSVPFGKDTRWRQIQEQEKRLITRSRGPTKRNE